jgi:cytoskeletal protein RodZ
MKVGLCLKKRREEKGFTIEEVARRTMLSGRYLSAIEDENFSIFPKSSYAKQFLRSYARFLGFTDAEVANMVRECKIEPYRIKSFLFPQRNWITYLIILLLVIIAYLLLMNLL